MNFPLTSAAQDYLEAIDRIARETGRDEVRVTDIARILRVKIPTVIGGLRQLNRTEYIEQEPRGPVVLTAKGRQAASALRHRHEDIECLLRDFLLVREEQAAADTCALEHGLSPSGAQCLHEFLEFLQEEHPNLPEEFRAWQKKPGVRKRHFRSLPQAEHSGGNI